MNTDKEAMEQALEALEQSAPVNQGVGWVKRHNKAKQTLREALAQPADEPVAEGSIQHLKLMMEHSAFEGRLELSDALANIHEFYTRPQPACKQSLQVADEPVAWYRDEDGIRIYYESKCWDDAIPLYTRPQLAAIPEGWKLVPVELLNAAADSIGSFVSDEGWKDSDMDTFDAISALLAAPSPKENTNE